MIPSKKRLKIIAGACRRAAPIDRLAALSLLLLAAEAQTPVAGVLGGMFPVTTPRGSGMVPLQASLDWSRPQPGVTRAVVVFHGKGRNAAGYYRTVLDSANRAGAAAQGSITIAPQFLDEQDIASYGMPWNVLRWRGTDWEAGDPADRARMGTFDVVDAIIARLSDRSLFPNLQWIVLVGHSGGAQLVQRYAVVGKAAAAHDTGDIHIRYVIANPSSYLYFSQDRPAKKGGFEPFHGCRSFNHWKYGTEDPPSYVESKSADDWTEMESKYAKRDVIYLLGTADKDPHQKDLDVTCGGEAEGPNRLARGNAYFAYLHARHSSDWNQRLWFVEGAGHSASQMIDSTCGIAAVFDAGACPDVR
jgi:pimeloyl-ACP methyl ester carboxylesterase